MFKSDWGCAQIAYTEPFYRQIPHYLHTALAAKPESLQIQNLKGNCFDNIGFKATFFSDDDYKSLQVNVELELADRKDWTCVEHLQISTAFSDVYEMYFRKGTH